MQSIQQSFGVTFDYPVVFSRNVFDPAHSALSSALTIEAAALPVRALAFIDGGLAAAQPGLVDRMACYFAAHSDRLQLVKAPDVVPGGEAGKNDYRLIMRIVDTILEYQLCRQSCVVVVGGGAVLDAVGFAASLVHRGLRMIRLPSTTLAQNDAGIGVKNAINLHGGKNTVGTFHPPHAVINDLALLETLPDVHWIGGIAEAVKVALIRDAAFFDELCRNAKAYHRREPEPMEHMIRRCAELHLDHIRDSGDAFERGTARPLDFGHWAAHKLESMSNYRISHGEAVATGVAIDSIYAQLSGWLSGEDAARVIDVLQNAGFELRHPELMRRVDGNALELLRGLDEFREHLGGQLSITFPDGMGAQRQESVINHQQMEEAIRTVSVLASARVYS
jgi:3-dehydroquinate synthase